MHLSYIRLICCYVSKVVVKGLPNADCKPEIYSLCFKATPSAGKELSDTRFGSSGSCDCLEVLRDMIYFRSRFDVFVDRKSLRYLCIRRSRI